MERREHRHEHLRLAAPLLIQRAQVIITLPGAALVRAGMAHVENAGRWCEAQALLCLGQDLCINVIREQCAGIIDLHPAQLVGFLIRGVFAIEHPRQPVVDHLGAALYWVSYLADEFAQAHGITGFLEDLARGGNRKGFARIHLALGQ